MFRIYGLKIYFRIFGTWCPTWRHTLTSAPDYFNAERPPKPSVHSGIREVSAPSPSSCRGLISSDDGELLLVKPSLAMHGHGGSSSSSTKPAAQRPPRPLSSGSIAARRALSPTARPIPSSAIPRSLSMGSKLAAPPSLPPPSPYPSRGEIVADVAQKRYALLQLGPRPDHERVDAAKSRLREIEANLSKKLQEIVLSPRPEKFDRLEWRAHLAEKEKVCREAAEKEISAYRAIVSLDEKHEECERMLREAERRLVKMYESAEDTTGNHRCPEPSTSERARQESMKLLLDSLEENCLEQVNLSGRRLRFLPDELFGRIRGVTVLNLSGNQLEVSG